MDSPALLKPICISVVRDEATEPCYSHPRVCWAGQSSESHPTASIRQKCGELSYILAVSLSIVAFCGGCSDSNVATVTGSTLYNGQHLPEETRVFFEQPGTGYVAAGIVQADGSFALNHNGSEEILAGDYTAYVGPPQSNMTQDEFMAAKKKMEADYRKRGKKPPPSPDWVLPTQYYQSSTSPIRQTIEPGENTVEILLED